MVLEGFEPAAQQRANVPVQRATKICVTHCFLLTVGSLTLVQTYEHAILLAL